MRVWLPAARRLDLHKHGINPVSAAFYTTFEFGGMRTRTLYVFIRCRYLSNILVQRDKDNNYSQPEAR